MTDLDALAADLCAAYQAEGVAAFLVRTTESGDVRYVGLRLPSSLVGNMLRTTAQAYEEQVAPEVLQ